MNCRTDIWYLYDDGLYYNNVLNGQKIKYKFRLCIFCCLDDGLGRHMALDSSIVWYVDATIM